MSRRVWGWLGLCLALAAVRWGIPAQEAHSGPAGYRLPPMGEWQQVQIERTGWTPVTLQRAPSGWQVGGAPVDRHALTQLQEVLGTGLGIDQRSEARTPEALARFGLGEHSLRVTLTTAAGARTLTLGKVLDGQRTFMTASDTPEGTVLRAQANLRGLFERPPHTWPQRTLFEHGFAAVQRVARVEGERVAWALSRPAPDRPWVLTQPDGLQVGQAEANGVVNTLVSLEVDRFEAAPAPFTPAFRVEAQTFAGERFGLQVAPGPTGLRVQPLRGGPIAQLPRWVERFIDVPAADLQERRLLSVDPAEVRAVAARGDRPLQLHQAPDGRWVLTHPERIDPLDPARVQQYLHNVTDLRVGGFAPRLPADAFDAPHQVIDLRLADDRTAQVVLGARFGEGRYAKSSERDGGAFVVGAGALKGVLPTPDDLRPGAPGEVNPLSPRPAP